MVKKSRFLNLGWQTLCFTWRITRLWKIRHIGHSSASLQPIHSFGKVKRSTIFCWFPVYYTSLSSSNCVLFSRLAVTIEWVSFGNLSARTKWGAELECHTDRKVSEIISLTDRAPGIIVFSYDYIQLHLQGTTNLPMSILAHLLNDSSKLSGFATSCYPGLGISVCCLSIQNIWATPPSWSSIHT